MDRLTKIDGIGQAELKRCFGCGPEKAGENNQNCGMCDDWNKALAQLHEAQNKSVSAILHETVEKMCENYCKYPEVCGEDEEKLEEICMNCPLNNLV